MHAKIFEVPNYFAKPDQEAKAAIVNHLKCALIVSTRWLPRIQDNVRNHIVNSITVA